MGTAILPSAPRRLLVAPAACGCMLLGVAGYMALVDPAGDGSIVPPCPFHATTGLWCPGCGLSRATHALLRGNFRAAFGFNVLFPFFLAAIVVAWLAWMRVASGRPPRPTWVPALPAWTPVAAAVVLIGFGVLRNLAGFDALAP